MKTFGGLTMFPPVLFSLGHSYKAKALSRVYGFARNKEQTARRERASEQAGVRMEKALLRLEVNCESV